MSPLPNPPGSSRVGVHQRLEEDVLFVLLRLWGLYKEWRFERWERSYLTKIQVVDPFDVW